LGAQITDFSYWNLTLITMFLIAKLVLVEVVSLLPLTQWKSSIMEINAFSRVVSAILAISAISLIGIIWWNYHPGNSQVLSNISNSLLFVGIKVIIFTLGIFLINRAMMFGAMRPGVES